MAPITWYWMSHSPDLVQREFTGAELAVIAVTSIAVVAIVVVTAIILYHILERIV